jgi:hypothetical protein
MESEIYGTFIAQNKKGTSLEMPFSYKKSLSLCKYPKQQIKRK